jgi:glucan phosphoethanolaminetransferase (alkaline phosphatase superfamily)
MKRVFVIKLIKMKDLIQNIESRFQILITLSILFPSLIYYLGKVTGQTDAQAEIVMLQFGILIGAILIDYVIFQSSKHTFSEKLLHWINEVLLWSIAFFAAAIFALAVLANFKFVPPGWMIKTVDLTLGTLVVIVLAIPVVIEFILIIFSALSEKKHRKIKRRN